MMDLNGSLTRRCGAESAGARPMWTTGLCIALLALGACHDDSSTSPKTASSITVASGAAQTGTVGSALAAPVVLQVNDQNGTGMAGVSVAVTAGAGSGSASAAQLTTDANGQVSVSWTLGTVAGVDTLVVQAGSVPVPNVAVTFADDENGTFGAPSVTTDAGGIATDTITLGGVSGTDDVTVTVQTANGPVTVTLHETAM